MKDTAPLVESPNACKAYGSEARAGGNRVERKRGERGRRCYRFVERRPE